jgi:hypothetical protein
MNIIRRHIDNMKLLLICTLLLSHPLIFCRFSFYQYMVVFLFNFVIYVFLLKESMYSYCCLCTVRVFLLFVHVFLTLSIYSYYCLCILIVVCVFLLFVHVFLSLSMYTYCFLRIFRRGYLD